jgi:hypothetical protein
LSNPCICIRFRDDTEDSDLITLNAREDPQVINAKSIMRTRKPPKTLDPDLADLGRLVPQMDLDRVPHLGSFECTQATQILDSFWG